MVDGCPKEYKKMNSLRYHLTRHHPQEMMGRAEERELPPETDDVVADEQLTREEEQAGVEDNSSLSETDGIEAQDQNFQDRVGIIIIHSSDHIFY